MKLREPWTFFIDRSLGREVVAAPLKQAGLAVQIHDDHFAQNTEDAVWLREVGARGWVVLSKDKDIRRNALELRAILDGCVACFQLGRGDRGGPAMAAAFLAAMPRIQRALRRFDVPMVGAVSAAGGMRVLYSGNGWLDPPKELK